MGLVTRSLLMATVLWLGPNFAFDVGWAEEDQGTPRTWMRQHPEYNAVLEKVHTSGAACVVIGTSIHGEGLASLAIGVLGLPEIYEPLQIACSVAKFRCRDLRWRGTAQITSEALAYLADNQTEICRTLSEVDEWCCVEVWDSPTLLVNLELLSQLPTLEALTVYTTRSDKALWDAIGNVKVARGVTLRSPAERRGGEIMGQVVDQEGKPVAEASVNVYTQAGEPLGSAIVFSKGMFMVSGIYERPHRLQAFAAPPPFAPSQTKVASSAPVDAQSGEIKVRLVIERDRLVPQSPSLSVLFPPMPDDLDMPALDFEVDWEPSYWPPSEWLLVAEMALTRWLQARADSREQFCD